MVQVHVGPPVLSAFTISARGRDVVLPIAKVMSQLLAQARSSTALVTCDNSPSGPNNSAPAASTRAITRPTPPRAPTASHPPPSPSPASHQSSWSFHGPRTPTAGATISGHPPYTEDLTGPGLEGLILAADREPGTAIEIVGSDGSRMWECYPATCSANESSRRPSDQFRNGPQVFAVLSPM